MPDSSALQQALRLPNGARFYKCALQVNPFSYVVRHDTQTDLDSEESYNRAIVDSLREEGIEVIAVTDHYRIKDSKSLIEAARAAGIHVFPGFEAATKDGVHFLCLFDPDTPLEHIQAKIHDCGVHDDSKPSPLGKYDTAQLSEHCRDWGAVCIAAHVASGDGLLRVLSGQVSMAAWASTDLLACSLPGPVKDAPDDCRSILQNKDPQYRREQPVAILNCQDISRPADAKKAGTSCWIKMSSVSIEGLRQAFLDPESRIRLASDPPPEDHVEFVALAWKGGFLNDAAIHLNENLNVLIGGRGTGKSSIIESLRYVLGLEPSTPDATKLHQAIIRDVLQSGTRISLLVRSYYPNQSEYVIERTVPNPPIVKNETGNVLDLSPTDIIPKVELFGQHEISELARHPAKRTRLLERFIDRDDEVVQRKETLKRDLERSRRRLLDVAKELEQIDERLTRLPAVEETLKRYQSAKVEEKLKEQSLLVREERVLITARERIAPFKSILTDLRDNLPVDRAFASEDALRDLPGQPVLRKLDGVLKSLDEHIGRLAGDLDTALAKAEAELGSIAAEWNKRKQEVQGRFEALLRELQKEKIDGAEFIRLRKQIEELRPLQDRKKTLLNNKAAYEQERRNLLAEWEDARTREFQRLERAAKKVSKHLGMVRVRPEFSGNREPLIELLESLGGRLSATMESLKTMPDLSLTAFAAACRRGKEELAQKFGISPAAAARLAQAGEGVFLQIEEIDLLPTTSVELNISTNPDAPDWKDLEALSTGQKATAILLLLLLEADAPLVVDQPEDDLDNRFITESVVPAMRREKRRRQFIFSTHNANIPVLGDAELIVGLSTAGDPGDVHAEISPSRVGSIDCQTVREYVEEILEGGKDAFEMRRRKYGF